MTDQKRSYFYAALVILFWSTVATAFKLGLKQLPPSQLLMYASITSFFVLFTVTVLQGKLKLIAGFSARDYLSSLVLAFLNPFIYYLVLFKAYSLLPAQVAQPLNMIWPLVLVFFSVPLLGQRIGLRAYIALFISFVGVMVISSQGEFIGFGNSDTLGVILAIGSSFVFSLYFIFNLRDKRDDEIKLMFSFLFASILLVAFNLIKGGFEIPPVKGVAVAVYIGVFEMGVSFLFWLKALKYSRSADMVARLIFLVPFLSLIFIHFILGENIYITTFPGLLLIIAGILYQKTGSVKKSGSNIEMGRDNA